MGAKAAVQTVKLHIVSVCFERMGFLYLRPQKNTTRVPLI